MNLDNDETKLGKYLPEYFAVNVGVDIERTTTALSFVKNATPPPHFEIKREVFRNKRIIRPVVGENCQTKKIICKIPL